MNIAPNDNIVDLLQSYLNVQSRRAEVISGNIANADTPGYVAKEVNFEDYLRDAAERSSLPARQQTQKFSTSMSVGDRPATAIGLDGNTVDSGQEMAELAQAGSMFNFGAKMLQSRLRLLRTAIREGR